MKNASLDVTILRQWMRPEWVVMESRRLHGCDFIILQNAEGKFRGLIRIYGMNGKLSGRMLSQPTETREAVSAWLDVQAESMEKARKR